VGNGASRYNRPRCVGTVFVPASKDQNSKTDRHSVIEPAHDDDGTLCPRLIVVSGMMLGLKIELTDVPVIIGRSSECGLALPHPSVSRQHCRVWREDGRYLIEDLGSTNRTFLNGKAVTHDELRDGDQIGVGSNAIKFFVGDSVEASYHHELIDLAIYDSLTGFYNRRHFRGLLDEEVEKAKKSLALSLLMLDLDDFKGVNDRHGHLTGDQVLSAIAHVIRECAPAGAPIGRLGGEEFALALRGGTLADAAALAEKLRAAVAARPVETREHRLDVTISIGVAQTGANCASSAELLRNADEQLYRAKQGGRNRVCRVD
jgi:diguanylate cyclase (GGDEF)-like protein